jgi:hypothetical protein
MNPTSPMRMFAPGDLLAALRSAVPLALVSPEALDRALAVARLLPECALWASLECRLGAGEERVDFSACVPAAEGGREALLQRRAALLAEPLCLRSRAAWERIFAFCAEWGERGSLLEERVPFVFIEFDLDGGVGQGSPREAPPFVLFHLLPRSDGVPDMPPARTTTTVAECRSLLGRALLLLDGHGPSPAVAGSLRACLDALPAGGSVAYAAPLSSRGLEAVRLLLILPRWQVVDYLRRMEWGGPLDEIEEDLATLPVPPSEVWFDLDVGQTVLPAVGLVFSYPPEDPRWRVLLDRWVERGDCTSEKRDAVLAWPGRERVLLPGFRWPLGARRTLVSKIVHRRGQQPEAKIYLEASCRFSLFVD